MTPQTSLRSREPIGAARITFLYAAAAAAWIFATDSFVWLLHVPADQLHVVSLVKGIAFVVATSAVLALILRRRERQLEASGRRLELSEARFRSTFENSSIAMAHLDQEGRVLSANPPLRALAGEIEGQILPEIASAASRSELHRHLGYIRQDVASVTSTEFDLTGPTNPTPVHVTISRVSGSAEEHPAFIAVFEDLSARFAAERERKQLEQERHASAHHASEIINSIPATVFELATDGQGPFVLTWVSDYVHVMTGYPCPEWTANPRLWIELIPAEQRDAVESAIHSAAHSSLPSVVAFDWHHQSGEHLRVKLHVSPIGTDPDAGRRVRCVAIDSTAEMIAEHALASSERYFRNIIDNTSDIITVFDPDGTIRYQSPSISRILGWSESDLVGEPVLDFIHPDDRQRVAEQLATLVNRSSDRIRLELRFRGREGNWQLFESEACALFEQEAVEAVVASSRDITERRMLENQLERSGRVGSLGRLATTVAHEFNNLLMSIQPSAELLRKQITTPALEAPVQRILAAVKRGKTITSEILRFTRPVQLHSATVDLRALVHDYCAELPSLLPDPVDLQVDLAEPPVFVHGDAAQITQAISNITRNAMDAMPDGGTLRVSLRCPRAEESFSFGLVTDPEKYSQLTVSDTGVGLSREAQQHLFEPLFTTKSHGTGLGLVVTDQIVRAHGGIICYETSPGEGTTFHLFFPMASAGEAASTPDTDTHRNRLSGLRMLLVEDEIAVAEGLRALLELEGLDVEIAATAAAALEAVERRVPDIVVLDLGLPDRDGLDVYVEIADAYPQLPVVFSTGHGDASRLTALVPRRNVAFLQKPYEMETLLDAISSLHEQRSER